jgi:hypothetical protein
MPPKHTRKKAQMWPKLSSLLEYYQVSYLRVLAEFELVEIEGKISE